MKTKAREQEKITETKPPLSHLEFDILIQINMWAGTGP
jgi:hypothetical protein